MSECSLPRVGQAVVVRDPLGYTGTGRIVEIRQTPHPAALVRMETVTDRTDTAVVGREVWVLAPHLTGSERTLR